MNDAIEAGLVTAYRHDIDAEFQWAEANAKYEPADIFRHTYQDMPSDLQRQQAELESFLAWKEQYPWPS